MPSNRNLPPMPSNESLPPFTGMALDRVSSERKDAAWVRGLTVDPQARAVLAGDGAVAMTVGDIPALVRRPLPVTAAAEPILLGLEAERPLFAVDVDGGGDGEGGGDGDGTELMSLRDAGALLSPAEGGLAAYAVALLNWHRRHRFCANCGARTELAQGGYSRRCPACGATHFPRTDPCVIMLVEHEGRLLLGRRAGWPEQRLSLLAGFVAAGESAEAAVVREVYEESGIVARDPVFVASQPWPFPASLMLGFHAMAQDGEPRAVDHELADVRWVDRAEVRRALAGDTDASFQLPPAVSIARFLIERWVNGGD